MPFSDGNKPLRPQPRTSGEAPPRLSFDEYAAKYAEYLEFERRDGILQVSLRNGDGWTPVWNQAWRDIGNDHDNKVVIITNEGAAWIDSPAPMSGGSGSLSDEFLNIYRDNLQTLHHQLFSMVMPTIAVVRGPALPGIHLELALMCDVTLCSDDAIFREMHAEVGVVPGDGQFLALQQLIGPKHAAYYAFTADAIDAEAALRLGLVSEVDTRERILARAWEIAAKMVAMSDISRYMTTQLVRRPWQRSYVEDAGFHLAHEMFAMAVDSMGGSGSVVDQWTASYLRSKQMGTGRGDDA
ncbi:enoyl-CoA hydratase/isomerase family protein [Mycobacterium sp. Aquia_216]|uniref:enoyl-CoA hydratase/isomerase family protein n=1 Tax=Mycobacterium sp. Aquia_216 TaxID=2991729 RepID=UPI00227C1C49|nr:enoyl-CoA hydratase/isomerase family protein [Mycobacterium sp. Aquia_216]WAJ44312.1 enoyl-CoA hydratase/isomerase family protein [Mycobacterium sp. Aquia_216]